MSDDRLAPLTRLVLAAGVVLTLGTGLGLWLVPGETESYWAWVIRAPLSAAFLGAGYTGAAVSLGLALHARRWTRARTPLVSALVLTSLALVATVRHDDTFLLGRGDPLPRTVAWIWLVVYLALPPLAALAFLRQERRASAVARPQPLDHLHAGALVVTGVALAVPGILLLVPWQPLVDTWPWQLAPLPAELVGGWLVTAAVTLGWVGIREHDWCRARPAAAGGAVFVLLLVVAALRLRDGFAGGGATAVYAGALAGFLLLLAWLVGAYRRSRRHVAYGDVP